MHHNQLLFRLQISNYSSSILLARYGVLFQGKRSRSSAITLGLRELMGTLGFSGHSVTNPRSSTQKGDAYLHKLHVFVVEINLVIYVP